MWKWIGVIALCVVVLIVGAMFYGYRTLTAGGDSVAVTIGASPQRVFASLADHDSVATWRITTTEAAPTQHGRIAVGDTLPVGGSRTSPRRGRMTWIATDVTPGRVVAFALRNDSTGAIIATRRDSIVAAGDSTTIVSTIASPLMDSLRVGNGDEPVSGGKGTVLDMSSKLVVSSFRMQSKAELTQLKDRLEGRPARTRRP